ncbi:MAG: rhodanese-like domain-containing protein, partial [Planctomycetales bacterium]|nr:rhodanese-like domain-containing protein [Planctomycetales bacterium]
LDGKYATWCGTVLDKAKPIIVVADDDRLDEAIMRLGRIGFDQVVGYLEHGPEALESRPELVAQVQRMTALDVEENASDYTVIVDVRTEKEWQGGHIADSINIPLNQLADRVHELPSDKTIVVHCQGGYRSSIAASLMQKDGYSNVFDMVGGFEAWKASQLPVAQTSAV